MCRNLKAALRYAELGWPVLPLGVREKLPIGRLVPNGVINATTSDGQIMAWWREVPDANIGIACENLFVVDVDPRNDGEAGLDEAVAPFGGMPRCPTVQTGSGGTHYFFVRPEPRISDELRGKLCPGVDLVHGRNRYVVAAPSVIGRSVCHFLGPLQNDERAYRWTSARGVTVGQPPEWLLRLARRPPPTPLPPRSTGDHAVERARRYLAKCDPAVSGANGHNQTFKVCCAIAERFELAEQDMLSVLAEWNARCEPPWSSAELARKLAHALRHTSR